MSGRDRVRFPLPAASCSSIVTFIPSSCVSPVSLRMRLSLRPSTTHNPCEQNNLGVWVLILSDLHGEACLKAFDTLYADSEVSLRV